MQIINKFLAFFEEHQVDKNQNFLLACSGGIDSMVLFHLLAKHNFHFAVAHCNFQLRANASIQDADFVKKKCKEANAKAFIKTFDTEVFAKQQKISIQMAARQLRYEFFDEILEKEKYDFLLTAHHLTDSFETFLINAGRSTGTRGLSGIPAVINQIARPLHRVKQQTIHAYAKENKILWREDASNASVKYQRNAIRHKVLPDLLKSTEGYTTGFETTLGNLQTVTDFAEEQAHKFLENHIETKSNGWIQLSIPAIKAEKGWQYLLHFWLSSFGEFDLQAISKAVKNPNSQYFFSETHELLSTEDHLILKEKKSPLAEANIQERDTNVMFGDFSFSFQQVFNPEKAALTEPQNAFLDYEKLSFPLTLRTWQKGDRFTPYGMKGSKKISDFFTDQHLNKFEKEQTPLLLSGEEIVWVVGYRINEHYKITNPLKTAYFGRLLN